ncbi:glycerate kinase, partial [Salmonella enterica subsp. enterica serovar Typhimurium]|nr:glycerate kinase [Salmonella enterica subsp. enterica serovar Typhimurium]
MQRIIVIPDSFKGALSSREAGSAIATGLASVTDAELLVAPIADGGEGTVEAFVAAAGGALQSATVCGVFFGERVPVHYG